MTEGAPAILVPVGSGAFEWFRAELESGGELSKIAGIQDGTG